METPESKIENRKSSISTHRVSRFFAMGYRCGELGRTEGQLPLNQCENDWQRAEMRDGFSARMDGPISHVQFWLVEGEAKGSHVEIEEKILTTKNTNDTKGE